MMAVTAVLLVLIPVNAAILPLPLFASPIEGLLLIQEKVVPETMEPKITAPPDVPSQIKISVGCATVGIGLTVILKVLEGPLQFTPLFV